MVSTLPVENVRTKIANATEELIVDFFCFSPSFPDCVQTHLIEMNYVCNLIDSI